LITPLKIIRWSLVGVVLAAVSVWVGAFVSDNGHWVAVRVPEPRWSLGGPVQRVIWDAQLCWLVVGAFASGAFVLLALVWLPSRLRQSMQRRQDRRLIERLEAELADLRNLPVLSPMPLEDVQEPATDAGDDAAAEPLQDDPLFDLRDPKQKPREPGR